jgi:NAD(P)-dependent dehydrogenase (short-subunit alcohol dehydrogenase family)
MKVFVAGASGAIGRSLVPQLVAAGHEVTGTTRSEQRAEMIRASGARAAICDALDADALRRAAVDAAPDVIVHELTALSARLDRATSASMRRPTGSAATGLPTYSPPPTPSARDDSSARASHSHTRPARTSWQRTRRCS